MSRWPRDCPTLCGTLLVHHFLVLRFLIIAVDQSGWGSSREEWEKSPVQNSIRHCQIETPVLEQRTARRSETSLTTEKARLSAAVLSEDIRQGVTQISTGAWLNIQDDGDLCQQGNPNVLCLDKGISELGQGPIAHSCLVEIEPAGSDYFT
jgi:hypothetical protein